LGHHFHNESIDKGEKKQPSSMGSPYVSNLGKNVPSRVEVVKSPLSISKNFVLFD